MVSNRCDPTVEGDYRKIVTFEGNPVALDIIDFSGLKIFKERRKMVIQPCDGIILVYDVTSQASFKEFREFKEEIDLIKKEEHIPLVLVGNKSDRENEREVPTSEGQQLALEWNAHFFECSAKTGHNIEAVFEDLIRQIKIHKKQQSNLNTQQEQHRKCNIQ